MTRIVVDQVTKRYGAVTAVDNLSFALAPGSITGLVGANGAGKSTTLRILLGLTAPTSGSATFDGHHYHQLRAPARSIGAVLDPDVFHPGRTGRNALRVLAATADLPERRIDEVLALVDLLPAARRRVRGYSTGMRQRLALAAALLGDPPTLVLDEPSNGLDPAGIRWLRNLLRGLADEGRTILVSSHQLAELAQTVDHVLIIDHGRLIASGSVADLIAGYQGRSLENLFLNLTMNGTT